MTQIPEDSPGGLAPRGPGNPEPRGGELAAALPIPDPVASKPILQSCELGAAWYLWIVDRGFGEKARPTPSSLPPVLTSPPCGIYDVLRRQLVNLCSLRRIVEEKMASLSAYYRTSVSATRLQLCAWAYPKGSPPRALYWIRLGRRHLNLDDRFARVQTPEWPHWFHRLKIRNRTEMRNHLYWNGLVGLRDHILPFYERAKSLNEAHATLARRTPHLVSTCSSALRRIQMEWLLKASWTIHRDPVVHFLNGSGGRLLDLSWALAKAVQILLHDVNCLLGRGVEEERIQLFSRPDWRQVSHLPGHAPIKIRWLFRDPVAGRTSHSLRELGQRQIPDTFWLCTLTSSSSRGLFGCMLAAEEILGAIRRIGDRMEEIRRDASDLLDRSEPLEAYYVPP